MDLGLIGSNPVKILNQLRRASRARFRYIFTESDADRRVDPVIEHQLTNHVLLLESLAQLAGVNENDVAEAIRSGSTLAQSER